jgi:hypothetical protein
MDILTTELPNTNKEQRTRIRLACLPQTRKLVRDGHIQVRSQTMNTGCSGCHCWCTYMYVCLGTYITIYYTNTAYILCVHTSKKRLLSGSHTHLFNNVMHPEQRHKTSLHVQHCWDTSSHVTIVPCGASSPSCTRRCQTLAKGHVISRQKGSQSSYPFALALWLEKWCIIYVWTSYTASAHCQS